MSHISEDIRDRCRELTAGELEQLVEAAVEKIRELSKPPPPLVKEELNLQPMAALRLLRCRGVDYSTPATQRNRDLFGKWILRALGCDVDPSVTGKGEGDGGDARFRGWSIEIKSAAAGKAGKVGAGPISFHLGTQTPGDIIYAFVCLREGRAFASGSLEWLLRDVQRIVFVRRSDLFLSRERFIEIVRDKLRSQKRPTLAPEEIEVQCTRVKDREEVYWSTRGGRFEFNLKKVAVGKPAVFSAARARNFGAGGIFNPIIEVVPALLCIEGPDVFGRQADDFSSGKWLPERGGAAD